MGSHPVCDSCGCHAPGVVAHIHNQAGERQQVLAQRVLQHNDEDAAHNRQHFRKAGILAINLISSPGAGKTALLEATVDRWKERFTLAVLEGDPETDLDARRIRSRGVAAVQITTGGACHLDAALVHQALDHLPGPSPDLLFIENVGNLVCPSAFDLGEGCRVVLLSVPEGDDKVDKYPATFRKADLVIISKADLLGVASEFQTERVVDSLRRQANGAPVLLLSARTGAGMDDWFAWLEKQLNF